MNRNSASDYFYNFRCLLEGKRFTRTLNADSMEYFFGNILKDYGADKLANPLSALMQHIDYYEGKQNTTMNVMREIHSRYSGKVNKPILITSIDQLKHNIETIENYLTDGNEDEKIDASDLIKRGICFVAYKVGGELRFAPSKFLGYVNNGIYKFDSDDKNGGETNKAIRKILKSKPLANDVLEQEYIGYCSSLGFHPNSNGSFGVIRKFWEFEFDNDFQSNINQYLEFPEGKIVERIHKSRERNYQVVELAKRKFKEIHGTLFCEICEFDFEKKYGDTGTDYIEGHHTIAVSDMPPDYKTKPEEIAMLCSNCHRMVHKKRPWLSINDLKKLLK